MSTQEQSVPVPEAMTSAVQRTHPAAWLWLSAAVIALDQATKFLEVALGLTAGKQRKPEYHKSNRRQNQQRLGA